MGSPQTLSEADRRIVAVWAADCAERVLGSFEAKAPGTPGLAGSHSESVETTQIAPTILHLLGLNPNDLQAVRIEGTKTLPGS